MQKVDLPNCGTLPDFGNFSISRPTERYPTAKLESFDSYVGVRVMIGAGGVEKIVEVELDDEAKRNLQVSVDAVRELLVACKGIDPSLG